MEVSRIHDDITQLLYKVEEQYSRIIQFRDSVPLIEVDLALKDVRDLYESFMDLRTAAEVHRKKAILSQKENHLAEMPSPVVPAQEKRKDERKPEVSVVEQEPTIEKPEAKEHSAVEQAEEKEDFSEFATAHIKQEESENAPAKTNGTATDSDPILNVPAEKAVQLNATPLTPVAEKPAAGKPIVVPSSSIPLNIAPKVDLLKEREKDFVPTVRKIEFKPEANSTDAKKESIFEKAASLYDKIAKPGEKTVASQASRQPISNIKSSIGINEKFAYLKDLFKNNINEYNEALDKLNNFESYADAEDFFQELKGRYSWDPEGKSFQGLADLLNRRYLHNA